MIPTMKRIGKEKEMSVAMVVIFCGGFHRRRRIGWRFIRTRFVCVVLGKMEQTVRNIQREYVK